MFRDPPQLKGALRASLWACLLLVLPLRAEQTCDTRLYPLSAPNERYALHEDGTVTDVVSDLMWMRCSVGQTWSGETCVGTPTPMRWQEAEDAAVRVNDEGEFFFNDWRLPTLRELAMIAERQCENPRINLSVFAATPADFYWTTSTRAGEEGEVYALSFGPEGAGLRSKDAQGYARLVRTDQ